MLKLLVKVNIKVIRTRPLRLGRGEGGGGMNGGGSNEMYHGGRGNYQDFLGHSLTIIK